jgi:2-methylcitrate dehydratase PrpD
MASGIKENFGSMAKPLQVGHACHKGLLCALLASEGITSSLKALEGEQGFLNVYNGKGRYRLQNLKDFGKSWEIISPGIMFKKYACCGSNHPVIDAALDLVKSNSIEPENVNSVLVCINPRRLPHVNRPVVTNALEAKFSLQYAVTVALIDHDVSLRHFTDAAVNRDDIKQMLSKIEVKALEHDNDSLSQACEIHVGLKDGGKKSIRLEEAYGRRAEDFAPVMKKKFLDCAQQVFQNNITYTLLNLLQNIDKEPDINSLMNMLIVK